MAAFLLALVLLGLAAPLAGASADDDRDYLRACLAAAGGQTAAARNTCFGQVSEVCLAQSAAAPEEMAACAERELAAWQALLDDALARLEKSEPEPRVESIRAAQEVWRRWRTHRCEVYGTYEGPIYSPLAGVCRAETTSRRVVDLWEIEAGFGDG